MIRRGISTILYPHFQSSTTSVLFPCNTFWNTGYLVLWMLVTMFALLVKDESWFDILPNYPLESQSKMYIWANLGNNCKGNEDQQPINGVPGECSNSPLPHQQTIGFIEASCFSWFFTGSESSAAKFLAESLWTCLAWKSIIKCLFLSSKQHWNHLLWSAPAHSIDQAVFCQLSRSQDDDGLLGHLLLLQLLRLQLLLLGIVVGEVVNDDGDGQGHDQDPTHGSEGANLWMLIRRWSW